MSSDLDLKLTVNVDKDAIVKSFISGLKEAKREADKQTVTYTLKPDKTSFLSEINSLLSSSPDLKQEVKLVLDDSSFKKGLDDVEKYSNKSLKSITTSYKKEFQKEFSKDNPLYLDNLLGLNNGENKSQKKVKEKVSSIIGELSKYSNLSKNGVIESLDLTKVKDYKDLEKVVNLTKELDAILKQTGEKGYKVDFGDRKTLEKSIDNLQSGYSKAMIQYRDSYKTQLESMKSDTIDVFTQLQTMLKNVFLGVIEEVQKMTSEVKNGVTGIGDSMSDDIQKGVEKSKQYLQDLENKLEQIKKKKQELNTEVNQKELFDNANKTRQKVDSALEKGNSVSKKDAEAYISAMQKLTEGVDLSKYKKEYDELVSNYEAVQGELKQKATYIPINEMKTRNQLLQETIAEEQKLQGEISKEKKLLEEKENIETSGDKKDKSDSKSDTVVKIDIEQASENIQIIQSELDKLPETKTIKINVETQNPNKIQEIMSGWNEADKKLSDLDVPLNERFALFNKSNGYISNSYVYDAADKIGSDIIKIAVDEAKGQADSMIHTHGDYNIAALSPEDVSLAITALNDGITKNYVMGLKEVSMLDLSSVSKDNMLKIETEFSKKVKEIEDNAIASLKAIDNDNSFSRMALTASDDYQNAIKTALMDTIKNVGLNPEDIYQTMSVSDFTDLLKTDKTPNFDIELKTKLAPSTSSDIQNQINAIEPKPTIEVKAKIDIPKDIKLNDLLQNSNKTNAIPLSESTKYIDELKKNYREISSFYDGINLFKGSDVEAYRNEATKLEAEVEKIIQKYPELNKLRTIFSDSNIKDNFIDTEEWNNFLATLPKAYSYLESIGQDFSKNNQAGLSLDDEIKNLNGLKTILENINELVNRKTEAFNKEDETVGRVALSEKNALEGLETQVKNIIDGINEAIEKLHNPENTKIALTPELSKDFETKIQELINSKTFEIALSPAISPETKNNSLIDFEDSNFMQEINEGTLKLTKEEKQYDALMSKATREFLNGVKASTQAKHLIKEELKQMVAANNIDSGELYEILRNDATYASDQIDDGRFIDIRKFIRSKKIKYSKTDQAEFGDEWNDVVNTFGRNLSSVQGMDPEELLRAVESQYGKLSNEVVKNTQDALRVMYEYLSETPAKFAESLRLKWLPDKAEMEALDNKKIERITKDAVIPTSYLGEVTAQNPNELDRINAEYATQIEKENIELERHIELLEAETKATNDDVEAQKKYNESKNINKQTDINETSSSLNQGNINQGIAQSSVKADEETKKFNDLEDAAIGAGDAKKYFADKNKEVLISIINSLTALNSEGNGFKNLSNIIKQLSKEDASKVLINNLKEIRDIFSKDINDNSLINAIKEISKQGDNLKDLAEVLKSSKKQIENSQNINGKTTSVSNAFNKDKKTIFGDLSKLSKRVGNLGNVDLSNELKQITLDFNNVGDSADKLKAVADSIVELTNKTQIAENEAKKLAEDANVLTKNYQELALLYKQLRNTPENSLESEEIHNRILALETENKSLEKNNYTQEQSQKISRAKSSANIAEKATIDAKTKATEDAIKAEQKVAETEEKARQRAESLRLTLLGQVSALKNNGKLMGAYGDEINTMVSELSNTGVAEDRLNGIRDRIREIRAEANQTGKTGKSLLQILSGRFQSLIAYLGTFASFYRIIGYIRQAFSTLIDLDTQLVDLRKTTTMSASELNEFYNASADVAKGLGVTTSEIISQASAWSRLGYSTKEAATTMAEMSSKFASISPGMTTDQSTDYLVSTMQAYGIAVEDVERKIMDNVNRIGNTFATTNAEIGEMLTRSSAAMKAANNSLEETIALESAAVEVTRNAETTGTAFRTVSMRIRGLDEETEEALEDYEELKGKIADLTKTDKTPGGVSLFTDASKTEYKSTYQFLKDISAIWDKLTDKNQAQLLETIGGKRGAQSLAPILSNFKEVERAMDEMENAAGAADDEMNIIRDSLEFKLNALKQEWVQTLQEISDRGDIGRFIDGLTAVSEAIGDIVNNLGILKTALIGIGTVWGSQKLGYCN